MIKGILLFPFWVLSKGISTVSKVVQLVVGTGLGIIRFMSRHILASMFGALIGLFLGKGRIGVKFFKKKKR